MSTMGLHMRIIPLWPSERTSTRLTDALSRCINLRLTRLNKYSSTSYPRSGASRRVIPVVERRRAFLLYAMALLDL
jgi:hypothetical protein